jgi:hypothetical protein
MNKIKAFIYKNWGLLSLIFICFVVLLPILFISNIPKNHDIQFHMSRIIGIKDAIALGDVKALIHPSFFDGYGYANGLFYPNFFLYIPALLCLFGMSVFSSYKILIIACTISTAFSMYYCAKKISLSKTAATIASILYVTAPYRIVDVYQRGAVGEIIAFIFVPLVILGLYQLFYDDYKKWWYLAIGFAGLLLSHIISFTIVILVAFFFMLVNVKKFIVQPQRIWYLLIPSLACLLGTSFFLFPMLEQLHTSELVLNNVTTNWDIHNEAMPLANVFLGIELLAFPCGIGLVFIAASFMFSKIPHEYSPLYRFCKASLITGLILLFVTTDLFPWKAVAFLLSSIQFPWRFLLVAVAFLSISSSLIINYLIDNKMAKKKGIVIGVVIIPLIASTIIMGAEYIDNDKKINLDRFAIGYGEYLPYKTKCKDLYRRGSMITTYQPIKYSYTKEGTTMIIDYQNDVVPNYMEVPLLYYYGYKAVDLNNGQRLKIEAGNNNTIRIHLDNISTSKIKIYYGGTMIQHFSMVLSISTVLFLAVYYLLKKRRNMHIK